MTKSKEIKIINRNEIITLRKEHSIRKNAKKLEEFKEKGVQGEIKRFSTHGTLSDLTGPGRPLITSKGDDLHMKFISKRSRHLTALQT